MVADSTPDRGCGRRGFKWKLRPIRRNRRHGYRRLRPPACTQTCLPEYTCTHTYTCICIHAQRVSLTNTRARLYACCATPGSSPSRVRTYAFLPPSGRPTMPRRPRPVCGRVPPLTHFPLQLLRT